MAIMMDLAETYQSPPSTSVYPCLLKLPTKIPSPKTLKSRLTVMYAVLEAHGIPDNSGWSVEVCCAGDVSLRFSLHAFFT